MPQKEIGYRDGGHGFIKWCEDHVRIPIYPEGSDIPVWAPMNDLPIDKHPDTKKSYKHIWEEQKKVCIRALKMKNKRFVYRVIVLCWQRGEGKSLLACLIQLWKFFNWPKQQIMLGANSKDQVKFVHYDIMRDIIYNSPKLLRIIGKRNIQEKEVRFKSPDGQIISLIRTISSFSGIVSNITGYTFSEIFDMKNPKFFVQLDGSTRNIPNALGIIDSTVSAKTHVLYKLYLSYIQKKDPTLFFSYRYSKEGDVKDYWNPNMTQVQLESYKSKFPLGDFERYFLNLWSAGSSRVFTEEVIEGLGFIGADGILGNQAVILDILRKKNRILLHIDQLSQRGLDKAMLEMEQLPTIEKYYKRLKSIEDVYTLTGPTGLPTSGLISNLEELSDMYDTNWAILIGIDRADPMKQTARARTIISCVAKGLAGSRKNPMAYDEENVVPAYLYFLFHLASLERHSLEEMKDFINAINLDFDGVDMVCGERWGTWDLAAWCEEQGIPFEPVFPTYDKQKAAFGELFIICNEGRFKAPQVPIHGSKDEDILREELSIFDHDPEKRWFGSPEKYEKYGIQDDAIFSIGWCIHGGRNLGLDSFRSRKKSQHFGVYIENRELLGAW